MHHPQHISISEEMGESCKLMKEFQFSKALCTDFSKRKNYLFIYFKESMDQIFVLFLFFLATGGIHVWNHLDLSLVDPAVAVTSCLQFKYSSLLSL